MATTRSAAELKSDLRDTEDWDRKGLVDFNAQKTQLFSFHWFNNSGAVDVEMLGLFSKKNYNLRSWGFLFLLKCIGARA